VKGKGERVRGKGRNGMERKKIETFEDLKVWQKGIDLVKQIYLRTKEGELSRDFGLRDQLRRASVSILTNIAEGFERYSRKEYLNFLNIAKGSAGEVRSLLRVALEVGYLDQPTYTQLSNQAIELSRMLSNQIQSINQSSK
ncbi:four helix bundle protein, partial [Nostoc sp. UIC 10630]|uniref:four helix bundle protein n=2 Tax=unclassified Nostoc TaxID=2593658 RepID=UPI0031F68D5A